VFIVPLPDGTFGLGQALSEILPTVMDCALFTHRLSEPTFQLPSLSPGGVFAVLGCWKKPITSGAWPVLGIVAPLVHASEIPNQTRLLRRPARARSGPTLALSRSSSRLGMAWLPGTSLAIRRPTTNTSFRVSRVLRAPSSCRSRNGVLSGPSKGCRRSENRMRPNPSLHPKCYSGLRPLPPSGELKR
jgi:hypothetical protein